MTEDAVRVRFVDDVALTFVEPERDLTAADFQRWHDALSAITISKTLLLTVGPLTSDPEHRRVAVALLQRQAIRMVAVTENRRNRGLMGVFSWLGVPVSTYSWAQLEDAARDVASRAELVAPIVRAALALRAESPAAAGLDPGEG